VGNGYNVSGNLIPSSALTCNMDTDIAFLNFFYNYSGRELN